MSSMVDIRTFTHIDVLQPQLASFLATISQGYLPVEGQASLYIEIAPGIAINRLTDVALKHTDVRPGMQVVERAFGVLELHSFDHGSIHDAGRVILERLEAQETDRLKPRIESSEIITGVDQYQAMLINRMRHGQMLLKGETLFILETHPAGYALIAANEAEKAASINLLEARAFGAFGRLYLGGPEAEIREAVNAVHACLEAIEGRPNDK
ncbi:MAG: hypothetical protein RL885_29835 [Planctomycetota bacterium]